jgi:hypothetical protein
MSIDDRRRGRFGVLFRLAVLCLAGGVTLAGCDTFKQAIGVENVPPDEFAVESQAPLTIPPDFDLRPPKPGAPRPHEVSSEAAAQQLLAKVGPGKPIAEQSGGLPDLVAGGGGPNPNAEVRPNSLSQKLLSFDGAGGATVEKRETEALKEVY